MTIRAVLLGLLGAALIAAAGYLNDGLLRNTFLVGNHFPISVFGLLIVAAIGVNPVLARLAPRLRFRPGELAVATALLLAACSIPGSGLMRTFTPTLVMPAHYNRVRPNWRHDRILSYFPPAMMPAVGESDAKVVNGFLNGLSRSGESIGVADVPWQQWRTPLATWLPLVVLLGVSAICLSVIVHPQWSRREHLPYPIASFATSLMGSGPEADGKPAFRKGIFWTGLLIVLSIRVVNGLAAWLEGGVQIPTEFDLWAIAQRWPGITRVPQAHMMLTVRIFPTVVAFGFLLASQVSVSLGIGPLLMAIGFGALLSAGVDMSGGYVTGGVWNWQLFGSYLGLASLVFYAGRHHYWQVAKAALTFRRGGQADSSSVWACRIALVSAGAMVLILARLGLDWPLAALAVALLLVMFLVMARINAETGLFFCQPYWQPMALFVGLFGYAALGPGVVAILAMLCAVFTIDPRECLMPFVVNALKISETARVKAARVAPAMTGAFLLALAVAVPVVLWANYNYGMFRQDTWATRAVPEITLSVVERSISEMSAPADSAKLSVWGRFKAMQPDDRFLWAAAAGAGLVLVVGGLRLRFAKFPLHPVMFLLWGTYPLGMFCYSFLLGWIIKSLVVKYSGRRSAYRSASAFMFGAIAGDLLGGLIFMAAGAIRYVATGDIPPLYRIFPG